MDARQPAPMFGRTTIGSALDWIEPRAGMKIQRLEMTRHGLGQRARSLARGQADQISKPLFECFGRKMDRQIIVRQDVTRVLGGVRHGVCLQWDGG